MTQLVPELMAAARSQVRGGCRAILPHARPQLACSTTLPASVLAAVDIWKVSL